MNPNATPRARTALRRWAAALLLLALGLLATGPVWAQLDHNHAAFDALLKKHVRWGPDQKQSRVDYAGFQADRTELKKVLDAYSAVPRRDFDAFTREQQMAFLVNAYNAFTIELILTRWPDLKSIKDIGSLLQSPWKRKFFTLLGEQRHLDWIEHEQLRPRYAEPRIHAAVNCASIGCPALRPEAFTAARLEAQLEDGMRRFMGDRTRNRVRDGRVEVSQIFKWFSEDFEQGHGGLKQVQDVTARYAHLLTDNPAEQQKLRDKALPLAYLDYDWSLNALGR